LASGTKCGLTEQDLGQFNTNGRVFRPLRGLRIIWDGEPPAAAGGYSHARRYATQKPFYSRPKYEKISKCHHILVGYATQKPFYLGLGDEQISKFLNILVGFVTQDDIISG